MNTKELAEHCRRGGSFSLVEEKKPECYFHKWHPFLPQCPNEGLYVGRELGNITDEWTWCAEHAPEGSRVVEVE